MNEAQLKKFNSPLEIVSVDFPHLLENEVEIRVCFAGINFYELMVSCGNYPTTPLLPFTLGGELSGEVVKVGKKVKDFKKADRVFSLAQTGIGTTGSYAQICHVQEKYLYHLPDFVSFKIGAAFPMIGFTAYNLLTKRVMMPKSGTVLIHSGCGGVGSTLIQLTKILFPKIKIVATCSNKKKEKIVKKLGADLVINTKKLSFAKKIKEKFPEGVDVIFDPTGQQFFDDNLSLLGPNKGLICSYGAYTGPITDPNVIGKLRKSNLTLSGFLMWPLLEDKKYCQKIFNNLFMLMKKKQFIPLVDKTFPLAKVNQAHQRIRARQNLGKVLLKCW